MKKSIFIAAAILISFAGIAQSRKHTAGLRQQLTRTLLGNGHSKNAPLVAAKTTAQYAERLKAQSTWGYSYDTSYTRAYQVTDSGRYNYSSDRTAYFDFNKMEFSNDYSLISLFWLGTSRMFGGTDPNDRPDMLCDTSYKWGLDYFTYLMGLDGTRYCVYDSNNNITECRDYDSSRLGVAAGGKLINTYTALGGLSKSWQFSRPWGGTTWDSSGKRFFVYNSSGRLISDSSYWWGLSGGWEYQSKFNYYYDASGNLIKVQEYWWNDAIPGWEPSQRYEMTYYSTNKLKKISTITEDGGAGTLDHVDSFGWTAGLYFVTYEESKEYRMGALSDWAYTTRHISADSLPDTLYTTVMDVSTMSPMFHHRRWYKYDSYGEPTKGEWALRNDTTGTYDTVWERYYFYYEIYLMRTSAIASLSPSFQQTLDVYPNPFHNAVTLRSGDIPAGSDVSVAFYNMVGQRVWESKVQWSGAEATIPTETLPGGTYLLQTTAGPIQFKPIKLVKD